MYANLYQFPKGSHKHNDTITMWQSGGLDAYGQPAWDGPNAMKARVEKGHRVYYTENGREVRGRYYIFLPDESLKEGDTVYVGESSEQNPPSESFEVKQVRIIPSVNGNVKEYRFAL